MLSSLRLNAVFFSSVKNWIYSFFTTTTFGSGFTLIVEGSLSYTGLVTLVRLGNGHILEKLYDSIIN